MNILTVVLSALLSVNSVFSDTCPTVEPVKDFDFTEFGSWEWYEIGSYKNWIFGDDSQCIRGFFTDVQPDSLTTTVDTVNSGTTNRFYVKFSFDSDSCNNGKIILSICRKDGTTLGGIPVVILDTDFETYIILYTCADDGSNITTESMWMLVNDLSDTCMENVRTIFSENVVINKEKFAWRSFDKDTCLMEKPYMLKD